MKLIIIICASGLLAVLLGNKLDEIIVSWGKYKRDIWEGE